jgi:ABC-type lipoprotein export system ATPase subunit
MVAEEEPLIRLEAVSKVYRNGSVVEALRDVSFEVAAQEFLAIVGPSGSGKTTLLNLLGTLDEPTSGRIGFAGEDLAKLRGDALADFRRQNIGFVFQLFYLLPELDTLENVMLPLIPFRRRLDFDLEERARELLGLVGLGGRLEHLPGQLSGGEQQRAAIARALINRPKALLADEPTGNLDSRSGQEIVGLLQSLNRELGLTLVVVTHNRELAAQAQAILRLQDGRVVDGGAG